MYCIVEISVYPMTHNYEALIRDFVERINSCGLDLTMTETSTLVRGEYDTVFECITGAMREALDSRGRQAIVLKVMNTE